MADVSSMNESDWGPEQSQIPPVGSIFILKLFGGRAISSVASKADRFKLVSYDPASQVMLMDHWAWSGTGWQSNHSWRVQEGVAFRVLVGSTAQVSIAKAGCHCRKCREYFPFAEPNQTDGSLVCWNCRNYPHYQGSP